MRSMTGCGRCQALDGGMEMTLELKCVNHRFLDVACRLPRSLAFLEAPLRQVLAQGLKRGHVEVFLSLRSAGASARQIAVDEGLAAAYSDAARKLASLTGREDDLTVSRLLTMDGVAEIVEAEIDQEAMTSLCRRVAGDAVRQVILMREQEGAALQADLTAHLNQAEAIRERILARAPQVVADYRQRLEARLAQLPIEPVDPARLAQEVALLADRCAIDEELSRLDSHIRQMRDFLSRPGEVGKKMDFLIQEMNREANTIGSKANDAAIAQMVVELKSEVEKLREQIQNVE